MIIGNDNDDDDDGCAENAATTFNGRCDTTTRSAVVDTNAEVGIITTDMRDGIISPLNKNDVETDSHRDGVSEVLLGSTQWRRPNQV